MRRTADALARAAAAAQCACERELSSVASNAASLGRARDTHTLASSTPCAVAWLTAQPELPTLQLAWRGKCGCANAPSPSLAGCFG
eukprot:4328178-Pleurochrysis_carterae.AAC.3